MSGEYPFLKATKPDGTQYIIKLEDIITEQGIENFISIGRQTNNHIVLPDPQKKISRHHCSLQYRKNRWWIVDENSANGTFLQRESISQKLMCVQKMQFLLEMETTF